MVRRPAEITHEARGYRGVNRPLRALVLGDAGSGDGLGSFNRLEFADFEAATIEKLLRAHDRRNVVTRLSREAATHTRVVDEIGGGDYDIIHFGGHAWFDEREAFFMLWDRLMLGSELAPLLSQRPPALMVLDTHYTAFVLTGVDTRLRELVGSPSQAATTTSALGPRGFAEAAMRCGVTSFVGAFGDIGDRSGAELSIAFFANVLRGATVAEALRAARGQTARATFESGMFYTVFGYPDFRLVDRSQSQGVRTSIARALAQAKAGLARVGRVERISRGPVQVTQLVGSGAFDFAPSAHSRSKRSTSSRCRAARMRLRPARSSAILRSHFDDGGRAEIRRASHPVNASPATPAARFQ